MNAPAAPHSPPRPRGFHHADVRRARRRAPHGRRVRAVAFWPEADFGATTPKFRLLFGKANERDQARPPDARRLIDLAWLHALHARSSLARGRGWQAEYMVGRVREHALALACLRHGLPAVEGRGLDRLPAVVTRPFEATLAGGLADVGRAFQAVTELFVGEIEQVDADLARRIGPLLRALVP